MSMVIDIHKINGIRPEYDVYIGRRIWGHPEFTRSSKWANGYRKKDFGLELSLKYYERKIRKKIKENPEYYNLDELKNKKLGCWCITTKDITPAVCHGQILMKILKEVSINE